MICQTSYENAQYNLEYLPEIAFQMTKGLGILNIGAGIKAKYQIGKT